MNFAPRAKEWRLLASLRTSSPQEVSEIRCDDRHTDIISDAQDLVWLSISARKLGREKNLCGSIWAFNASLSVSLGLHMSWEQSLRLRSLVFVRPRGCRSAA